MAVRVLLINPNQMQPPIAPVGLDYLADVLSHRGHKVSLLDLCFHEHIHQPVVDAVREFRPQMIGMTVRNTDDCYYAGQNFILPRIKEVINIIRHKPSIPIAIGGVGFSIAPEETFQFLDADFGVEGEGEEAFCALVEQVALGRQPVGIPGILYRDKGRIVRSVPRFSEQNNLSKRSRSLVDNKRYFAEGGQIGFETKRGCTMACVYCADPIAKGRAIRMRSPSDVVDELKALLDQGIDHFHTCDSEFNLPEEHAIAVCEEIARAGLGDKIRWYAYCAPTPFGTELAGAMKEAGCVGIDFGADSGDDSVLASLKRHFRANDLVRTAQICRQYGFTFMYDLLIGGPGETYTSVKHTINLMKEISPDCVGVSVGIRIYNGTRIAEIVRNQGPMEKNPSLYGAKADNPHFLKPVFYIAPSVGPGVVNHVASLIGDDPRFFSPAHDDPDKDYNYSDNDLLVKAIKDGGYRGAYWDILRRLRLDSAKS